jgi:histidinol-phosphate/aromatic aminotransferase/cobyric acid decarboxylase-like protein
MGRASFALSVGAKLVQVESYKIMANRPIHGGSSWEVVHGRVSELNQLVTADVCDAWYPPAPEVIDGLREALNYIHYAPETWGDELRSVVANHYSLPFESVFVDAGSSPLIHRLLTNVAKRDGNVVLVSPSYSEYQAILERFQTEIRFDALRLDQGLRVDVDRLLTTVDKNTTAVVLCNPNNPTGGVVSRSEILRLAESVPEHVSIIIDEVYVEYTPHASVLQDVVTHPSLCVIRSFSKTHALAGLRAGFAATGAVRREAFEFDELPWRIGLLSDVAVRLSLQHESYIRSRIDETRLMRDDLQKRISAIDGYQAFESQTNFFMVHLANVKLSPALIAQELKTRGVLVKEVQSFPGSQPSQFVRVTTRSVPENDRLVEAFKSVARI